MKETDEAVGCEPERSVVCWGSQSNGFSTPQEPAQASVRVARRTTVEAVESDYSYGKEDNQCQKDKFQKH